MPLVEGERCKVLSVLVVWSQQPEKQSKARSGAVCVWSSRRSEQLVLLSSNRLRRGAGRGGRLPQQQRRGHRDGVSGE